LGIVNSGRIPPLPPKYHNPKLLDYWELKS